jgi:hypothetical protein
MLMPRRCGELNLNARKCLRHVPLKSVDAIPMQCLLAEKLEGPQFPVSPQHVVR